MSTLTESDRQPDQGIRWPHGESNLSWFDRRDALDFLAAFASDGCFDKRTNRVEATPFCFINGSSGQYFLSTVRQLISEVCPERVQATLFSPWTYQDQKLSLRWDPHEDRRYALMDRDPGFINP